MGEIINLRKARKSKARASAANEADSNRARFGRTPAERDRDRHEAEKAARALDGAYVSTGANDTSSQG